MMEIIISTIAVLLFVIIFYRVLFWQHELKYRIVKIIYGNNNVRYRIEESNGIHWYGHSPEYLSQEEAQNKINEFNKSINDNTVINRKIL